jgi:hypothetical protein
MTTLQTFINATIIQDCISTLPEYFTSREFIKIFAKKYEKVYIDFLYQDKSFREVNRRIALTLKGKQYNTLIKKVVFNGQSVKVNIPPTIFGKKTPNQLWRKLKISPLRSGRKAKKRNE